MKVRCGACRTEFDVAGEGRHACPTCGAVNQVASMPPGMAPPMAGTAGGPAGPAGGMAVPPPPVEQAPPLPRVTCQACSFEFVVGDIEVASCPNCSAEVEV